jgi:hypothetical protein
MNGILFFRPIVINLAFLSFACLLGQFMNFWSMKSFGCWVLPSATLLLALTAFSKRREAKDIRNPHTWIVHAAIGGIVAA